MMLRPIARIFTILPLFVLITLSFLVFIAPGTALASDHPVARHSRQLAVKRYIAVRQDRPSQGGGGGGEGGGETPTSSFTQSETSTTDSESATITGTTTDSATESTTSSSSTSTLSESSSSTETTTSTSQSASSTSTSSFLPISTSTTGTFSSETSSSTASSSSTRSTSFTTIPGSTATSVVVATSRRVASSSLTRSSAVQTSASATSTEEASNTGFLSNKGAMAGTFTVVGLVAVGLICGVALFIRKRKRSEDLDIFDTEYKEYSSGNGLGGTSGANDDYFASDMSGLSTNAVSHAGAPQGQSGYNHVDYGYGLPPAATDRNSVASNHAGYGAFRSASEQRKPPMQGSGLRQEINWNTDAAYAEPAVDENQSVHVVPNYDNQYYASATRVPGTSY